jgi:hypothetical protein
MVSVNKTWTYILIAAVAALAIAMWLPSRRAGSAASPAFLLLHHVPYVADSDKKPSPFPERLTASREAPPLRIADR